MKIAVGIIGILLGLIVLLQSCAVATGGSLASNQELAGAGSVGVFVGLLFFVGGAFAFGLPLVSAIIFVIGSLLALMAASAFGDMKIWAIADLILAAMAFFAWRSTRALKQTAVQEKSL
ncbi:MAG: hypothetical protein EOQ86_30230 [Mesorhizobium sp.]|uniref:hypothetical protein n=1 Tax=Mesorhizobium sp. TaxID=1871066 RepID=UPI000FE73915|nr:hypothetical protein [Mesorhizobium sp.]RWH69474.1 MAG: hypothetical protein EOQ85_32815 [Mesorhizobium sp.]RWH76340.1 MAG: hypothetical protein EOQ86_30230 [Mesorhizobium sp.]RWH83530.1 MAG: hypothetical protein EOQ87_32770 [Mesorhizobium sp.]RWH91547.1 MAG: hypothetical protein EOQ88_31785 [Mesorhizobium sp.]RWH95819.1 MAG: hypothetical protein EOQ89_30440 [Mesorhizobium sp.]